MAQYNLKLYTYAKSNLPYKPTFENESHLKSTVINLLKKYIRSSQHMDLMDLLSKSIVLLEKQI